ncbi:MAG TPA: hypothetical protein VG937_06990 [Polyangiaceae bacterium]|nr:hypothetical protein [Polyangiaceae bacterium]
MTARCAANCLALLGLVAVVNPGPAFAADRPCSAMTVEGDANLRARWPDLLPGVRDELAKLDDLDTCAHVALSLRQGLIGVDVTLPDGRSASRTAALREDVIPTLQALLLVPEHRTAAEASDALVESTPPPAPEATRHPVSRARLRALPTRDERGASRLPPSLEPRALGIELSLLSGARIGDGQTSFGLGALSFLELGGWLIGGEARADRYQSLAGDSQETALELALLLGRRLQFSGVALDFTGGLAVAEKGIAISDTQVVRESAASPIAPTMPSATTEPPPEPTSGAVPRLLFGSRLGFSPRSVFRTFIGIDGEVGPARADEITDGRAPTLPTWTVGLALGATVGTK